MQKSENNQQGFFEKINPRLLFLVDGVGALITAFMLGVVLVHFENYFGMPRKVLHILTLIACVFSIYSFLCFFKKPKNWKLFLRIIALANLSYVALTLSLVFYLFASLTFFGVTYFILEVIIIVTLSIIELKTAAR